MGILDQVLGAGQQVVGTVASVDPTGILPQITQTLGLSPAQAVGAGSPAGLAGTLNVGQILGPLADIAQTPLNLLQLGGAGGGPVDTSGFSGGNGRFATRTTVETMDTTTGQIVKIKRMPGSPKLMNSEVAATKRVLRTVAKLHAKIPRRTVKQSEQKQLADAALNAAKRNVDHKVSIVDCK